MSKPRWRRPLIGLGIIAICLKIPLLIAQDQETIQARSNVAADDPRSPAYLAALVEMSYQNTGYRRVKNSRIWSLHDLHVLVGGPR